MRSLFLKRDKSASAGKDTVAEAWHTKSVDAVVDFLNSTKAGLSSDEAALSLAPIDCLKLKLVDRYYGFLASSTMYLFMCLLWPVLSRDYCNTGLMPG